VAKGASQAAQTNTGIGRSYSEGYQGQVGQIQGEELPFLTNELTNPQGYGAQQIAQMETAGGQATAGAAGAGKEAATLNASRTGNTAAIPGVIDATTRAAMAQQSNNALGIQQANANLKQQQQQEGVSGLEQMYGTDVNAALNALGLSTSAINAQTAADQESNNAIQGYIGDAEKGAAIGAGACWLAAAAFGEDFETGPKTNLVRHWLWNEWIQHWYAKPILALYRRFGERLAKSRLLVRLLTPLFEKALDKAENA
jgi:hypothetical protein